MTIKINERRHNRLSALIAERNAIQKDAEEKIKDKNELIDGLLEGHILGAGEDPDKPHGKVRVDKDADGSTVLIIEDAPPAPVSAKGLDKKPLAPPPTTEHPPENPV